VPFSVVVPVAIFLAMGVVVLLALWRIVVVGGEARRSSQSLWLASDVAHRAEGCIGDLAATVDALRHRRVQPGEAAAPIEYASATLAGFVAEARGVTGHAAGPLVEGLIEELERACRSLELIEYGRGLMESEPGVSGEGETSIKRGYLNLIHARDAIRQRGAEIRASSASGSALRAAGRR